MSRRRFFQGAAGGVAVGALGAGGAWAATGTTSSPPVATAATDVVDLARKVAFYDVGHPAGVQTKPQRYAVYMTFDMAPGSTRTDLQTLLARWSAAIARLMAGQAVGTVEPGRVDAVAQDSGEASGLEPASLTVTVGLGPTLFDDRFGLRAKRPQLLEELPTLPSDRLQADLTGGDLSLQACADDPQVAYHAIRNLARMVRGTALTRWTVLGFGRASAGRGQQTPRNLLGFKDGTRNVAIDGEFDEHVWVTDDGWMTGGTYQVARKILMNIEIWDADPVSDQQAIFGRTKLEGAPLSGTAEHDTPDFAAQAADGPTKIDPTAHIALAAHENNNGVKILRRPYNYTEGINSVGQLDAGLLFLAYMKDPGFFVSLQRKLGTADRLNEYIAHIGSAVFAVPPAPKTGHYLAEGLFS
ncbi:MAG: Dyp-type peroxidase [Lapillicoccus sp.]